MTVGEYGGPCSHGGLQGDTADNVALRGRLRHVYWIGGGSGAGKSTVARRLAERHGLRLYGTDEVMSDHAVRCPPEDCPSLREFLAMDMDTRWVDRSPEAMLETFHWFRGEGFELIVDDLLRLHVDPGVIVEGFRLLPRLVQPLLAEPRRALWLLPSPELRRLALDSRGSLWTIARQTRDPDRALRNLLDRDRMYTDRLRQEVEGLGLGVLAVDTMMTDNEVTRQVAAHLGF